MTDCMSVWLGIIMGFGIGVWLMYFIVVIKLNRKFAKSQNKKEKKDE